MSATPCQRVESGAVELYFYNEMPVVSRTEMASHLARCRHCRAALDDLEVIRTALSSRPDVSKPASGDWSAFMTRLDAAVLGERTSVAPNALPVRPFVTGRDCVSGSVVHRVARDGCVAGDRHDQRHLSRPASAGRQRATRSARVIGREPCQRDALTARHRRNALGRRAAFRAVQAGRARSRLQGTE